MLMAEALFKEEPISYFSKQIKKQYLPPEIKMSLVQNTEDIEMTGKLGRKLVKINDDYEVVIPDTYEKEKWQTINKKSQVPIKV